MDWDAMGAIGELAGAVAVLITLVALAIQIKRGREEFRRRSASDFVARNNATLAMLVDNPDLRELHLRAIKDYRSLSAPDQLAWGAWLTIWIQELEQALVDERHRVISGLDVSPYADGVARVLRTPGGRQWWDSSRTTVAGGRLRHLLDSKIEALSRSELDH